MTTISAYSAKIKDLSRWSRTGDRNRFLREHLVQCRDSPSIEDAYDGADRGLRERFILFDKNIET